MSTSILQDVPTRPIMPLHDLGQEFPHRPFETLSKRAIERLFKRYNPVLAKNWKDYYLPATVFPMRTNNYVVEDLINWANAPDDPIFQLVFPQPGMLGPEDTEFMRQVVDANVPPDVLQDKANEVRAKLNPHPAGQRTMNVPMFEGEPMPGLQHKYRETVLHFAMEAQYCHAYCTYCFRWAQFVSVGSPLTMSNKDETLLAKYLAKHPDVTDLLLTGGDPMVMSAEQMGKYLRPLLRSPEHRHVQTIRIGTKSLAYWPYRYVNDADAGPMLSLLSEAVNAGKHVSIMAHFTHPAEIQTPIVQEAIRRIRNTGAQIRTQAPVVGHVNDDPKTWETMWRQQVQLGLVPYYMFVSRDTGARDWFNVPLVKAHQVYTEAQKLVSGLARTARGPSMSCEPGKVHVLGDTTINGERVFVLKFLQARNPDWTRNPFFAKYDEKAVWFDQLKPAFGAEKFFFQDEFDALLAAGGSSGQLYQSTMDE
jgi:KamA family protein